MTSHEALWFVQQVSQLHLGRARTAPHRFTRECLYKNFHQNQQLFDTPARTTTDGEFKSIVRRLKQEKCVASSSRHVSPPNPWLWLTSEGQETLDRFSRTCPAHHFDPEQWSRRTGDDCKVHRSQPPPPLTLRCFC